MSPSTDPGISSSDPIFVRRLRALHRKRAQWMEARIAMRRLFAKPTPRATYLLQLSRIRHTLDYALGFSALMLLSSFFFDLLTIRPASFVGESLRFMAHVLRWSVTDEIPALKLSSRYHLEPAWLLSFLLWYLVYRLLGLFFDRLAYFPLNHFYHSTPSLDAHNAPDRRIETLMPLGIHASADAGMHAPSSTAQASTLRADQQQGGSDEN